MGFVDGSHHDQVKKTFTKLKIPVEGQDAIQQLFALKGTQPNIFEKGEIILEKHPQDGPTDFYIRRCEDQISKGDLTSDFNVIKLEGK